MSDSTANLRQRVLTAIRDPDARTFVAVVLDRCQRALADMREMEALIYTMYAESGQEIWELIDADALLEALAARTLRGARQLALLLNAEHAGAPAPEDDEDLEFDLFGEAPPDAPPPTPARAQLDDEIAGAVDSLEPHFVQSEEERLAAVRAQAEATGYGLQTQLADFGRRFRLACAQGEHTRALRDLDDIRSALTDGLFALMATIAETYLGELDRSQILPGHRSALERSIVVRRGLTELRRTVNACNARIQSERERELVKQRSFEHLSQTMDAFIKGDVLPILRPADRCELEEFGQQLKDRTFAEARLSCEGLDKFLDSLVSINQREVLVQHDRELMHELVELLDSASSLLSISRRSAAQLVRDAYDKAQALLGLRDDLDEVLISWRHQPADLDDDEEVRAVAERLAAPIGGR